MISDAVQHYHALLTDAVAARADTYMREKQQERGLYFGSRPLCVVLRPYFYSLDDWVYIKTRMEVLLTAFKRAHEVCIESEDHRLQLYLTELEEEMLALDATKDVPWTSSRLDTFYVTETRELKCVEYNAETPAGIGYGDVLGEVFWESEPMQRFCQRYFCRPLSGQGLLTDALMAVYSKWRTADKPAMPQIAVLDWNNVPTLNEHEITRGYFERYLKTRAILADPRTLEYRDGALYAGDFRIDMIYKRVLWSELLETMGTENPVVRAIRDGAVLITNSASAKLMAKKASLSFLSDERNADLFTKAQLEVIADNIPWTRTIEERKTVYEGQTVDLIPFVAQNKDDFVLKPNDDYGGKGVVLGWETSQEVWEGTLQHGLKHPYVAQKKVTIVERDFPTWINGSLDISMRYVDADPYVFGGNSIGGVLTRLSPAKLLNVTAGSGSVIPAFVIESRE
jgi:glutathionylspermidine synthase